MSEGARTANEDARRQRLFTLLEEIRDAVRAVDADIEYVTDGETQTIRTKETHR